MNIGSLDTSAWGLRAAALSGSDSTRFQGLKDAVKSGGVTPHQFGPNDELNKFLTSEDRTTILNTTGVDVRPDGTVMVSMQTMQSRSVNDTVAIMDSIGQIAADRANGKLHGPISPDYLTQAIKQFSSQLAANEDPFAGSLAKA